MKRYLLISVILTLFISCHTEVDFKGEESDPVLVLDADFCTSSSIIVYLSHSFFFLDEYIIGSQYYRYGLDGSNTQRNVVKDAEVKCRINDGNWTPMQYDSVPDETEKTGYTSQLISMQPGDTIRISASHKDYPPVSAMQVVPAMPRCDISSVKYNQQAGEAEVKLRINKYEGNADDYLCVYVWSTMVMKDSASNTTGTYDSKYNYCSTDSLFGKCNNIRTNELLYLPVRDNHMFLRAADFIEDGRTVSFRLKLKGKEEYSTSSVHVGESSLSAHFDIYATVESWTSDSYKHFTSMATYLGDYKHYYSAFDDTGTDFDVINWLEELSEMADDEFGTQAGVQIYSNIDGGLGHFGVQSRMYVSDQYYVTLNNN